MSITIPEACEMRKASIKKLEEIRDGCVSMIIAHVNRAIDRGETNIYFSTRGASYSSEILDEVMAAFRDKGYVLERNEDEMFISWDQATF